MSDRRPDFSICVPNFNYAKYVGLTLKSVLAQAFDNFEIVVSDNASTDASRDIVTALDDPRITLRVNRTNVGFAANLDRAAAPAVGRWMLLLSSDDLMQPEALQTYKAVYDALGDVADRTVLASTVHVVDGQGVKTGPQSVAGLQVIDWRQWQDAVRDDKLSVAAGATVWRVPAKDLLRRSLQILRNPLFFATTCYPRALYVQVEGYGAQRNFNPDKWFAYKLLGVAEYACIVDRPLFSYRVHLQNQVAQQSQSGALKHLLDEYAITFELPQSSLDTAGITRAALAKIFVEQDISLRGLLALAEGNRVLAGRHLNFGKATYPSEMWLNPKTWVLRGLLSLGPLGTIIARIIKERTYKAQIAKSAPSPVQELQRTHR